MDLKINQLMNIIEQQLSLIINVFQPFWSVYMSKICFIIMPIGDQKCGNDIIINQKELKDRYTALIKEAVHRANPELEIIRADDISSPGEMTADILLQIMNSDYVIADITYPNPNVFYELGLRHASKLHTILIKDRTSSVPFDVSHLRHIDYDNTPIGINELAEELKKAFVSIESNPNKLDNHFLEIAKTSKYQFMKFDNDEENAMKTNAAKNLILKIIKNPDLLSAMLKDADPKTVALLKEMSKSPEIAEELVGYLILSGSIKL